MESIFENEYEITLERYKNLSSQPLGKTAVKRRNKRKLLSIVIIILGLATIIQSFGLDVIYLILGIFFVAFGVFYLFFLPDIALRKQYMLIMKLKNNLPWIRKTCFYEDRFEVIEGNTISKMEYADIYKVSENETYIVLWQNEDFVLRLLKSGFITGTYEEFKEFINNKCPK